MPHTAITKNRLTSGNPLVVGAISQRNFLQISPAEHLNSCDMIELRLDELGFGDDVRDFAASCPLPLLITARGPSEGGANDFSIPQREAAYRALMPYASLLDIELCSFPDLSSVLAEAREKEITIIGSFHDFTKTPPLKELESKNQEAADIFKVATMTRSRGELGILADLLESKAPKPTSVMGMGLLGSAARPLLARLGSVLNYGYLGEKASAPGQWPAQRLMDCLSS